MAQEVGYQRQVGTSTPVGLPSASPAAFGASIGAAADDLGQAIGRNKLTHLQIERQQRTDAEAADFNRQFADMRAAYDRMSVDMRAQAKPGGAGHAEAMDGWWRDQAASLTEGITDERLRRSAQAQLDDFGARIGTAEYTWQQGARVKKLVTDEQQAGQVAANRVRRVDNLDALAQELTYRRDGIEAMAGVPDDVKTGLIRESDQLIATSFLTGVVERSPQAIDALLKSGQFDDLVTPQQQEQLRHGAQAEIHRMEAAARAEAAQQRAVLTDELGAEGNRLSAGAGTYQDRVALAQRYEGLGDKSKAEEWKGKAAEFVTVQGTRDWTLPQMDQRIAALTAQQQGKGLSAAEAHELAGLKDQRTSSATRLNQDGGALLQAAYATGRPTTPLSVSDPASFRRRAIEAKDAAARYGRPAVEPILETEIQAFKDLYANGVNGQLQAVDLLRQFGDVRVIAGAARQVAGNDDGAFRMAAVLPHSVARDVLRGAETLKSNPQVWKEKQAASDFQKWFGAPLTFLGGSTASDVYQASRSFFAQRATDGGLTQYVPGRFAEATITILGRDRDGRGGIAHWGQPEGPVVILPRNLTGDDFKRRLAGAKLPAYQAASGGHKPVWGDGHPVSEAELKGLLPTALPDGRYGFRRAGRLLTDERGQVFAVDVQALAGR